MIQKKICLIGSFAVGKTSLVQRYVNSIFSDKYLTTLGVKIDKKELQVDDMAVKLMIWDLAGEDEFMELRMSYLRGSSGLLFVVDGTRKSTLDIALQLEEKIRKKVGTMPAILLINKSDIEEQWQIDADTISSLIEQGWMIYKTSAKSGDYVENAFHELSKIMLENNI